MPLAAVPCVGGGLEGGHVAALCRFQFPHRDLLPLQAPLCFSAPIRASNRWVSSRSMAAAAVSVSSAGLTTHKGVTRRDGTIHSCTFCSIAAGSGGQGSRLLYDDGIVTVFPSRSPNARVHLLVVPKGHVENCQHLATPRDLPLVRHMYAVARHAVAQCRKRQAQGSSVLPASGQHLPPLPAVAAEAAVVKGEFAELGATDAAPATFNFHVAPYFNSINHLHMHALDGPWTSWWGSVKHTVWPMAWAIPDVLQHLAQQAPDTPDLPTQPRYFNYDDKAWHPVDERGS